MVDVNYSVGTDNDDGYDDGSQWLIEQNPYAGSVYFNVRDTPGTEYIGGVRFTGVAVPQGVTIDSATLTCVIHGGGGTMSFLVYGDDVDTAPAWSDSSRPGSGFTNTTNSGTYSSVPTSGSIEIDIADVVQELVNRASWASGNAMRFAINADATYAIRRIYDIDGAHSNEAVLDISYTAAGGGATPKGPFTHPLYGPFRGPIT